MFRKTVTVVALLIISMSVSAADERPVQEANPSCEQKCIEEEETCYARCPDKDEEGACADACYSAADACFNRCGE
ncbi:MAG: hypothetical protein JRG86_22805 [Deltaproteobacteria bacterium]|jgi:hypothetical protein|nr:hypothetical protein [Deltaproteobacteria bacterium]MBW2501148.1 hypothetical protein [Deltaproteobacteria bacterium]